ncbi:hypothetical protein [Silvibacterium acidisoli]|uniref:hypothetical protein n=1 Tax=Acidobacteriaceae bacterium ZG23-2 TaxID=2883246 RepID=UPI00406C6C5C
MKKTIDLTFPHAWEAEILPSRPLIFPKQHFVYPRDAEEVERGAMEVLVKAAQDTFLATCALGFADPAAPSGLWSCPDPRMLCAVSGGYAYLIDTTDPRSFIQVEYRPVLSVLALPEQKLLLFTGHHALTAWGVEGKAWQTVRLSWEGVTIDSIDGDQLNGTGWDLMTDRDVPFMIDLKTGERIEIPN